MTLQFFAEGYDIKFIEDYIKFLNLDVNRTLFNNTEGWTKLKFIRSKFFEATDKGVKNVVIFDGDTNPDERRHEILNEQSNLKIDFDLFLFPNNLTPGSFEHLLLEVIHPSKCQLVNCFDNYCLCVSTINPNIQIPIKSKVYAFLEATGQPLKIKEVNFLNNEFWDLSHVSLEPLKNFLLSII